MTPGQTLRHRARVLYSRFAPLATPARIVLDVAAWVAAMFVAGYLRYGLDLTELQNRDFVRLVPLAAAMQLVTGFATGLYRRRWRYGSFDEMTAVFATAAIDFAGLYLLNEFYFTLRPVPQSAVLVGSVFGLTAMVGVRYCWRLAVEYVRRPADPHAQRVLVYGDGENAVQVVESLLVDPGARFVPVGILDDRANRRRLRVKGVPVVGGLADLERAVRESRADALVLAVDRSDTRRLSDLATRAADAGVRAKVVPTVGDVLDDDTVPVIRDLTEEDLLGRHAVETDVEEIAGYVAGRRVLVTGAGGSIGSELCRQLHRFGPSELIMLDRDESALHAVQLSIHGRAMLDTPDTLLCDLRDAAAVRCAFLERRPQVVFHAAALKHLPLLEQFPAEAYKTNVVGTLNVLEAAREVDVEVFVNVSTDKAANPTSVLGYSKRVAERLTAAVGADVDGQYLSVRFGNVLGSRGSVLVAFREQISAGGPLTVTHPDVTRYFMTVREAVQLVIQAGAIGRTGEVLVLDMGEPVRIYDVARRLIAQSGRHVDIAFTGLRPGEKLHEELFSADEADHRPR
ncbi:MAG: polysaccharide biosynthesis protein, partial [Actinomyces sp.]